MDQTTQPQGNLVGFKARYKKPGDNRPSFEGRISLPGAQHEQRLALWARQDKNGNEMFYGLSGEAMGGTAEEQIARMASGTVDSKALEANGFRLDPGQVVLFKNTRKDETATGKRRPDFYGRWNPGTGDKLVALSVWNYQKEKDAPVMLTGKTQYPLPGVDMTKEEASDKSLQDLVDSGAVTRGMSDREGRAA